MLHLPLKPFGNSSRCTFCSHCFHDWQCLSACRLFIQAKSLSCMILNCQKALTVSSTSKTWKRLLIGTLVSLSLSLGLSHFVIKLWALSFAMLFRILVSFDFYLLLERKLWKPKTHINHIKTPNRPGVRLFWSPELLERVKLLKPRVLFLCFTRLYPEIFPFHHSPSFHFPFLSPTAKWPLKSI